MCFFLDYMQNIVKAPIHNHFKQNEDKITKKKTFCLQQSPMNFYQYNLFYSIPQAVCCSDGEHCCPEGYVCDLSVGECINHSKPSNELKKFLPNINLSSLPTKIGYNNRCPNSDVYCEDNSTCCEHDKEWSCCLFSNVILLYYIV